MEENMKNEKLNNGAKEIRAVAMTRAEKERMLQNILNSPVPSPFAPIASPFALVSFMAKIQRSRFFSYSIVACLFLFVSAGGIVSASHSSLPGSVFYHTQIKSASFRLSMAGIDEDNIESGIQLMMQVLQEWIQGKQGMSKGLNKPVL